MTSPQLVHNITAYELDMIGIKLFGQVPTFVSTNVYDKKLLESIISDGYVIYARTINSKRIDRDCTYDAAIWDNETGTSDYALYVNEQKQSMITVSTEKSMLRCAIHENTEEALLDRIARYKDFVHKETHHKQMGLLINKSFGLRVDWYDLPETKVDIELNYGKRFAEEIHPEIIDKINSKTHGLYLFHGPPGTGKTTYIKYLANTLDKKFIFIPHSQAVDLDGPSLLSLLAANSNCILVLEDAEALLEDREISNNFAISTILNLSDGIVGSLLKTSMILTYNVSESKIDKAILRKGRLCVDHTFDTLSAEEAQALATSLDIDVEITEPMTLGDVYNMSDETFREEAPKKKPIGFGGGGENISNIKVKGKTLGRDVIKRMKKDAKLLEDL